MPTMTSRKAGNWVDRGEQPGPTLERILGHHFARTAPGDRPWLAGHAAAVLGMVDADASEVQVAGYLRSIARELGYAGPAGGPPCGRVVAIALWHAAKAALVRDHAQRLLRGNRAPSAQPQERLSHWLAARLLTPEELAEFERGSDA